MESLKLIAAGFLLGFGATYIVQTSCDSEQVNYIDQAAHADEEIERAILLEIPQEQ